MARRSLSPRARASTTPSAPPGAGCRRSATTSTSAGRQLPGLPGRGRGRARPGRVVRRARGRGRGDHDRRPAARGRPPAACSSCCVSELPPRALEPPNGDSRLAAACRALGVDGEAFAGARHDRGRDDSHPYIKLDRDLCIACGLCVRLCDELQGTFALTMQGRGFETHVAAGAGERWIDSPCVACGACADGCPTGALNEPGLLDPAPVESVTTTTCGFCGVGCTLDVHVRGGRVAAVTPSRSGPVNRGHACVKGRFAHGFAAADDRLTVPLVRRAGRLRAATWDEALAAARRGHAADRGGARLRRDRRDLVRAGDERGELPRPEARARRPREPQR